MGLIFIIDSFFFPSLHYRQIGFPGVVPYTSPIPSFAQCVYRMTTFLSHPLEYLTPPLLSPPQFRSSRSYPSSKKSPSLYQETLSQQNFHGTLFILYDNYCFRSYITVNYVNILDLFRLQTGSIYDSSMYFPQYFTLNKYLK